ncbi:hypothetical protein TNCT_699651 [Trichonephila clavata]|uniref:BPTI/Kunitz inhibitor domain-containing protein n=1 Tax=Trichonephila clavata TaxID=2740835 RepID=A0A8X6FHW4_TRICU|nr:hypothetical protein TNCT_699651 [Trichonephila clavata]
MCADGDNVPEDVYDTPKDICSLPVHVGHCHGEITRWHYDVDRDQCIAFVYTGCKGNENNFETKDECSSRCIKVPMGKK